MKPRAEKYRKVAQECQQDAARARNRREKQALLKIAEQWLKLAKEDDKKCTAISNGSQHGSSD